jgi:hypothetical protein
MTSKPMEMPASDKLKKDWGAVENGVKGSVGPSLEKYVAGDRVRSRHCRAELSRIYI